MKEFDKTPDPRVFKEWLRLVNMSLAELKAYRQSVFFEDSGLKVSQAKKLNIKSGQTSLKWIIKMKEVLGHSKSFSKAKMLWTPEMWSWARRQLSFLKRAIGGMKYDKLYDERPSGVIPSRKLLSLLVWGHDPERAKTGKRGSLLGYIMS